MSSILELEAESGPLYRKVLGAKNKKVKFLKHTDFYLEVKRKMEKSSKESEGESKAQEETYNNVSIDIWYHISFYIKPEDVQSFALICKDTAAIVRTKSFWTNLFKRHCLKFGTQIWILQLPSYLQYDSIRDLGFQLFRTSVIEAFFYSYQPLVKRLHHYTLDFLIGRDYITAWHMQKDNCMWTVCYQLRLRMPQHSTGYRNHEKALPANSGTTKDLVNDWESLANCDKDEHFGIADKDNCPSCCAQDFNPYEGVFLLVIFGHRFIPFHSQLTYTRERGPFLRLQATRVPLTSDMRENNLELDFLNTITNQTIAVKYVAAKYQVLPWWHPDFKKYINYVECDKFT